MIEGDDDDNGDDEDILWIQSPFMFCLCRISEESEVIEGEVVEFEVDRPAAGKVAKMVRKIDDETCTGTYSDVLISRRIMSSKRISHPPEPESPCCEKTRRISRRVQRMCSHTVIITYLYVCSFVNALVSLHWYRAN